MQLYVLTLLQLFLASSVALYDSYRRAFSFVFSFRHRVYADRRIRLALVLAGVLLFFLNLLFPQAPGPCILGNLVPAVACLYTAFLYLKLGKGSDADQILNPSPMKGSVLLGVAILHFLFPFLVLL